MTTFNSLLLKEQVQELSPSFRIMRNSDGHISVWLNYREMTLKTIDLVAYNHQRWKQKLPPIKTLPQYWEVIAEEYGGKDSPLWQEEFENSFEAADQALKAFYGFDAHRNTKYYEKPVIGRDVHVGIDFGWYHPCVVIAQSESLQGAFRLHFHEVIRGHKENARDFVNRVKQYLSMKYPRCDQYWYKVQEADTPNAAGIADQGAVSPSDVLAQLGIRAESKYSKLENRIDFVNRILVKSHAGYPLLNFNPENEDLITCMDGGYRREWTHKYNVDVPTAKFFKDGINDHVSDSMCPIILCRYEDMEDQSQTREWIFNQGYYESYR